MKLNNEQQLAVDHVDGPSLVIAGAGSGKTRVLTQKVTKLLRSGVSPHDILCVTFTRNAAKEMRARLEAEFGPNGIKGLWIETFHGLSARIIRMYADVIGYRETFSIYDEQDQLDIATGVIADLNIKAKPQSFLYAMRDGAKELTTKYKDALVEYLDRLHKNNAIDFNGLIDNAIKILSTSEAARTALQHKFRYSLIDEYQDINDKQLELMKLLTGEWKNVCAVGDINQAIFSFQGANVKHIEAFKTEFAGAPVFYLNENYRCPKALVEAANRLISNNPKHFDAKLFSTIEKSDPIVRNEFTDSNEEALQVASGIKSLIDSGVSLKSVAVLCRTHAQRHLIESALATAGVPASFLGASISFNKLPEIKAFHAYLNLKINQRDAHSFKVVSNIPNRGITSMDMYRIEAKARALDIDIVQASKVWADESKRPCDMSELMAKSPIEIGNAICAWYEQQGLRTKSRNVRKAMSKLAEFLEVQDSAGVNACIEAYIQAVNDLTAQDDLDESESVKIMTVHAAKGLEFEHVFVPGCEEGVFPVSKGDPEDLEEERRLFYVACTRAKEKLYLSSVAQREWFGRTMDMEKSQFIKELLEAHG